MPVFSCPGRAAGTILSCASENDPPLKAPPFFSLDVYHVSRDSDVFVKYQEEIFGAGVVISLSYMKQSCIHMEWITVFALLVFYLKCSKLTG